MDRIYNLPLINCKQIFCLFHSRDEIISTEVSKDVGFTNTKYVNHDEPAEAAYRYSKYAHEWSGD